MERSISRVWSIESLGLKMQLTKLRRRLGYSVIWTYSQILDQSLHVLALSQTNELKLARTHIEPTGASTLIDMFKLNVGEPYAEEVSPFDREAFGEFMMIVAQ